MKKHWISLLAVCAAGSIFADDVLPAEFIAAGSQSAQVKVEKPPVAPQYDNRFGFSLDRLIYERIQNNSMYLGLDAWCNWGSLAEGEVRFGYNLFYNGRDHFTPVVGVGYMYNNRGNFHRAKFAYATAGFLYSHEFNSVFGLGVQFKGLAGQQVSNTEAKKFAWGTDLSVPIIFRFAHYRHWDITLEPYFVYMKSHHKHAGVFGGRGTLAYRF